MSLNTTTTAIPLAAGGLSHPSSSPSLSWSNVSATTGCWDEWNSYWRAIKSPSIEYYNSTRTTTTTYSDATIYWSITSLPTSITTATTTQYETGADNGHDAFATFTYTMTDTETFGGLSSTPISTGPYTYSTETMTSTYEVETVITPSPATPACVLPSKLPQCQSEWDAWVSGGAPNSFKPSCPQVTIAPDQCDAIITAYYSNVPTHGDLGLQAYITNGTSTFWPTTKSYAPSCTLGCQKCAITGNNVQLLYWPAATATAVEDGSTTLRRTTNSTITTGGIRTMLYGNTTLTSPTIYISYDTLYASNSCSRVGRAFKNTIVPVSSASLSSLAYQALGDWAVRPGQWGNGDLPYQYVAMPFNFTDLTEPVPDSVFNQLPWCQRELRGWKNAGNNESAFECTPRDAPYKPLIAVPLEVRNLDPTWASCTAWYGGLFDPPKALQGVTAEATPTVPAFATQAAASAASSPTDGLASQTSVAQVASMPIPSSLGYLPASSTMTSSDPARLIGSVIGGPGPTTTQSSLQMHPVSGSSQSQSNADPSVAAPSLPSSPSTFSDHQWTSIISSGQSIDDPTGRSTTSTTSLISSPNALSVLTAALQTAESSSASREGMGAAIISGISPAVVSSSIGADPQEAESTEGPSSVMGTAITTSIVPSEADSTTRGSSRVQTATALAPPVLLASSTVVVGGQTFTASSVSNNLVLANAASTLTISAQDPATTSGTDTLSLATSGAIVLNGQTVQIPSTAPSASEGSSPAFPTSSTTSLPQIVGSAHVLTMSDSIVTVSTIFGTSNVVQIGTQILSAGGPALTMSGEVVSEGATGVVVATSASDSKPASSSRAASIMPSASQSSVKTSGVGRTRSSIFGTLFRLAPPRKYL
ncbi:hypothetical protein LTR62_003659 [Meristemomyces frigidus]|uniref:Uncharacterized protein n=1 Tax=Meristemomyces frigidus TaxID=1508187 RepID=A0AAN7TJN0_9PEZI|nr:hypothetical protein LTR62_003659 [Meristemomyces frigidus]